MSWKHQMVIPFKCYGVRQRMAVFSNDGERWHESFAVDTGTEDYVCGYSRPHHPVPAIANNIIRDYSRGDVSLIGLCTAVLNGLQHWDVTKPTWRV